MPSPGARRPGGSARARGGVGRRRLRLPARTSRQRHPVRPVGDLVPVALRALDRGGILAVAGIHLTDTPPLNYEHELFYEKQLRSVTSNTRDDGRESPDVAVRDHVRATTHVYPMSQAQQALQDLKAGVFDGAAVLVNDGTAP